jgi:endoglucanase
MTLQKEWAGKWARPAGHSDQVILIHESAATTNRPAGSKISSPGGWYDAGDYNKYIVNSGITMATLLSAYEDFPGYFDSLTTHIPESGNALPDIIDEILITSDGCSQCRILLTVVFIINAQMQILMEW